MAMSAKNSVFSSMQHLAECDFEKFLKNENKKRDLNLESKSLKFKQKKWCTR